MNLWKYGDVYTTFSKAPKYAFSYFLNKDCLMAPGSMNLSIFSKNNIFYTGSFKNPKFYSNWYKTLTVTVLSAKLWKLL